MRFLRLAGFATLLVHAVSARLYPRNHDVYDYFALHIDRSVSPDHIAQLLGARHEGQTGELEDHHTFSIPKERGRDLDGMLNDLKRRRRRRRDVLEGDSLHARDALDGILWSQKVSKARQLHKRRPPLPPPSSLDTRKRDDGPSEDIKHSPAYKKAQAIANTLSIKDPLFLNQWHLFNFEQPGHDLNVTGLWLEGITGNGSISAIVDDGLDMESNDLKDNYFAEGSYDFNEHTNVPKPRLFDDKHGTRCAGEIAAVRNDVCGVGVAYDSKVAGIRILSKPVSDEDEASAINYKYQDSQLYSCSWGPVDDGRTMDAPSTLMKRAMVNGIQKGRQGLGSIFVFAAGNGAASEDNCNFDGYTNSIYSVTVGALDKEDIHPYYSESCSAQLVVAYSSGGTSAIQTTDVGTDSCFSRHGGTSAAGPLVVGVIALALGVRPELTWRDVQHLIVQTAVPVNPDDGSWQETIIGKKFSHDYGYGKVDAYSLVKLAQEWELVKPQAWFHSPWLKIKRDIPQGDKGLASTFDITEEMLKKDNFERVEHVTVTMNVEHTRRGDISVELRSPSGIISHLSTTRSPDDVQAGYVDWTFMSVAHWGESGLGKWTVIVKDTNVNEFNGTFTDWQLSLWGEAIDGKNQALHPLPADGDHDHDDEETATQIMTTTISPTSKVTATVTPTDHPDRPTKPTASAATTTSPSSTASATPHPNDSFLPSFFPTFGLSKASQVWIYGSLALILVFCAALGIYFLVQRRKRLRNNPRDDYEFEMVDDGTGLMAGGAGAAAGKKHRRRGGELYDAFAGESDEELLSEDEGADDDRSHDSDSEVSYHDEGSGGGSGDSERRSAE
ncbi:hypothetical protein AJ80_03467 [Polytolypa hystricis UAMH7299]|uniref:P/Homo B domain-containing protein n=1 Tax=Polytolypa hystricis (strain UAMH7299) TaxID=1447883 RepID=A0A2B7YJA5_POLH7|nr:hypothetical protein AJ80_03467 [Polytolypa hystricis UAMH7299]